MGTSSHDADTASVGATEGILWDTGMNLYFALREHIKMNPENESMPPQKGTISTGK